jgi:hypothetical protein
VVGFRHPLIVSVIVSVAGDQWNLPQDEAIVSVIVSVITQIQNGEIHAQ